MAYKELTRACGKLLQGRGESLVGRNVQISSSAMTMPDWRQPGLHPRQNLMSK